MSWNDKRSRERIASHLALRKEIEIEDLAREADLEGLLTETRCRRITGAHVYAEISNFPLIVSTASGDTLLQTVRALNIWQRHAVAIVENVFDGVFVHFQGARMHALFYRPYDPMEHATRAVLLQLVLDNLAQTQFNPRFSDLADFRVRSGADIGTVVGTRNGVGGDRELLFIGNPANWAAKIIDGQRCAYVTQRVVDALPEDISKYVVAAKNDGDPRVVSCTASELAALLGTHGFVYDASAYGKAIDDNLKALDLKEVRVSGARTLIDFDSLSIRDNKLVTAASVFGDIDGFTAYVTSADAESDKKVIEALRVFAAIRKELAFVVKRDHDAVRVQYQGDRTQGLVHLPDGNEEEIAEEALRIAAAMQSSFEVTLKEALPAAKALKLAVGVDIGVTLASKLGARGQRDRICIGEPVDAAAVIQQACAGDEVGISSTVYHAIRKSWQTLFRYDVDRHIYVATGLRTEKLDLADLAEAFDEKNVHICKTVAATVVAASAFLGSTQVTPARSWSDH